MRERALLPGLLLAVSAVNVLISSFTALLGDVAGAGSGHQRRLTRALCR